MAPITSTSPLRQIGGLELRFDPKNLQAEFDDLVTAFEGSLGVENVRRTLGSDLAHSLRQRTNEIRRRAERRLSLVVVGDFKRGKSTLINALIGEPVLTTDVTPETVTINRLEHSSTLDATVHLEDGAIISLQPQLLKKEHLAPLLDKLPCGVRHVTIRAPVELLNAVELVDTPGLGDMFKRFEPEVMRYLHECDALIYVVSALSPVSESEQNFLRTVILPQEFSKVIFVVNMMDMLPTDADAERVADVVRARLGSLFPGAAVFPISGLDELCRKQKTPRPNAARTERLAADFDALRAYLDEAVVLDREVIVIDRAARLLEGALDVVEQKVTMARDSLRRDGVALARAIRACEDSTSDLRRMVETETAKVLEAVKQFSAQAQRWMDEFVTRLDDEVVTRLGSASHEDVSKHLHFFLVDALRRAMSECVTAHQAALMELSASARKRLADGVANVMETNVDSLTVSRLTFDGASWTGTDVVYFVLRLFMVDQLLEFLFGVVRNAQDPSRVQAVGSQLRQALPALRQTTHDQVWKVYRKIGEDMVTQIQAAYEADLAVAETAMKRAQELQADGDAEIRVAVGVLNDCLAEVTYTRGALEALRAKFDRGLRGEDAQVGQDAPHA